MKNESAMPILNLIPEDVRNHRTKQIWIRRWVTTIICVLFFVGMPGAYIGASVVLTDPGMNLQIEKVRQKYEKDQAAIPLLRAQLTQNELKESTNAIVERRVDWSQLIDMLKQAAGQEIRFSRLSILGAGLAEDQDIELGIIGYATSQTSARSYLLQLEQMGIFDFVELNDTSREIISEHELIKFEIQLKVFAKKSASASNEGDK
ncbi:MAG: PilN domain-containing protein [Phycisphaerales bacterium]